MVFLIKRCVRSALSAFRRLLKTFLFQHSFPDVILQTPVLCFRGLCNSLGYFSHVKYFTIDTDIDIDHLFMINWVKSYEKHRMIYYSKL